MVPLQASGGASPGPGQQAGRVEDFPKRGANTPMHGVYEGSFRDLIEDLEAVLRPLQKMVVKAPEPLPMPEYKEPRSDELPEYYEPEPIPEPTPPMPPEEH
eukprot:5389756-Pyramimonas_sp.AAC.1